MPLSSVKRRLFTTPTKAKRRKTTTTMRVPKSLLPETKQYTKTMLTGSSTDYTFSHVPDDMIQGYFGNEYVGSKFKIQRLKINYDWTAQVSTMTSGIRMVVGICKDPSVAAHDHVTGVTAQIDHRAVTVLAERYFQPTLDDCCGSIDLKLPLNVEMSSTGSNVMKNNVFIIFYCPGKGTALKTLITYSSYFTG